MLFKISKTILCKSSILLAKSAQGKLTTISLSFTYLFQFITFYLIESRCTWINEIKCILPWHEKPSLPSWNPLLQLHVYDPILFWHSWSHLELVWHSSISKAKAISSFHHIRSFNFNIHWWNVLFFTHLTRIHKFLLKKLTV